MELQASPELSAFKFFKEHEQLHKLSMLEAVQQVKRQYIKLGFEHQLALYGVLYDNEEDRHTYRRIDILLDTPLTHEMFYRIYDFFRVIKPPPRYSIWIYGEEDKEIAEVWYHGQST